MLARRMSMLTAIGCLVVAAGLSGASGTAAADPATTEPGTADTAPAELVLIDRAGQRQQIMHVYSPSMGRVITLHVITPFDTSAPHPTLYLLNGAGGGEDRANWHRQTDIVQFLADKNVNVVTPIGGAFSYYTDWYADDPEIGRHRWTTFLTRELPPVIDAALGATGVNAIAGVSMSATSALNLAIAAPDLYRAVASYSGCASTSDAISRTYIELVLARADADVRNMWGEPGDPAWLRHDAVLNADKLRGKTIYISSATGLPGREDTLANPLVGGEPTTLANQIVLGGMIEAATNLCTHRLAGRLAELGIPATVEFQPAGTHSWMYWQDAFHRSWPILEAALR